MAEINKIWHRYAAFFHMLTVAVTLGITWGIVQEAVANQADKIRTLESKHDSLAETISSVKVDTAVTKSQVADIKESIGEIKAALNIPQKNR